MILVDNDSFFALLLSDNFLPVSRYGSRTDSYVPGEVGRIRGFPVVLSPGEQVEVRTGRTPKVMCSYCQHWREPSAECPGCGAGLPDA